MAMAAIITVEDGSIELCVAGSVFTRKEKRKAAKKQKRKKLRINNALKEIEEEKSRMNDPEEQERIRLMEDEENRRSASVIKEYEERERLWIQAMEKRKEVQEEELLKKMAEDSEREKHVGDGGEVECGEEDLGFVEEGPAEIIWQGNEIIVKKKRVRASKKGMEQEYMKEDADRPTSNPLPPQSEVFFDYNNSSLHTDEQIPDLDVQQNPNFGTEQDKSHCPFHFKTGACRFGQRCNRAHFYPDKSCTLLIKNMYNGPGLAWEQDEGLECTDEEIECSYEEFYEDVHTEFLKFGEIVNFKVCKNGSFHLRGNVYVQYVSLDSAMQAFQWMNGRYFAGKQMSCEYISVMKWKVAICGEYLKTRMKTCSHGSACNFIHCFRNPCGDYEWADWDNPPPSYWVNKMYALFRPSRPLHPHPPYDLPTKSRSRSTDRLRHGERGCGERRSGHSRKRRIDSDGDGYSGSDADRESSARRSRRHRRHRREVRASEKVDSRGGEKVLASFEGVDRRRRRRRR